ncbi:MAG: arsenate reductase ArsC, partial [Deltaproteobacteria bacterium]|nr:arsenate reductase ArsC [Deltaproteobacteria bacterium]
MEKILFICTKNSARSQMAEAWVNHDLAGRFEAFSAGTDPSAVHPMAVTVMREAGIDISNQRSKGLEEFSGKQFDTVMTLCDQANES